MKNFRFRKYYFLGICGNLGIYDLGNCELLLRNLGFPRNCRKDLLDKDPNFPKRILNAECLRRKRFYKTRITLIYLLFYSF